jgi:hypothetical protein
MIFQEFVIFGCYWPARRPWGVKPDFWREKQSILFNPFSTDDRMTTLLPIFVHSVLISGPIDSKPSTNERELNFR